MDSVATLTMNPAIDLSYEVDRIYHTHKIRARNERYFPGGGGINVARVLARLKCDARCHYLSGGVTGPAFDALVESHGLDRAPIAIAQTTRVATAVYECETGKEYRFTPQGPEVSESEWRDCLDRLEQSRCDWLVASGSLPRGVPAEFYALLAERMARQGTKVVLDTSGDALRLGIASGHIFLAKPSREEFEHLTGRKFNDAGDIRREALSFVRAGKVQNLAVTLGVKGAILASSDGDVTSLPALTVEPKSAVGAGDSFLAGMVYALARGYSIAGAFRLGIAAGTAAVLTPGSDLAHRDDIYALLRLIPPE